VLLLMLIIFTKHTAILCQRVDTDADADMLSHFDWITGSHQLAICTSHIFHNLVPNREKADLQ